MASSETARVRKPKGYGSNCGMPGTWTQLTTSQKAKTPTWIRRKGMLPANSAIQSARFLHQSAIVFEFFVHIARRGVAEAFDGLAVAAAHGGEQVHRGLWTELEKLLQIRAVEPECLSSPEWRSPSCCAYR